MQKGSSLNRKVGQWSGITYIEKIGREGDNTDKARQHIVMARYVHQLTTIAITGRQVEASTWWRGLVPLLAPSPHGKCCEDDLLARLAAALQNYGTEVCADLRMLIYVSNFLGCLVMFWHLHSCSCLPNCC